jgi:hypothetical protein
LVIIWNAQTTSVLIRTSKKIELMIVEYQDLNMFSSHDKQSILDCIPIVYFPYFHSSTESHGC